MSNELVIEKNIPVPTRAKHGTGITATARKMEVGDSFLVEGPARKGIYTYLRYLAPMRFTTRTVDGGIRIWRVE